jgi:hypothetical protein
VSDGLKCVKVVQIVNRKGSAWLRIRFDPEAGAAWQLVRLLAGADDGVEIDVSQERDEGRDVVAEIRYTDEVDRRLLGLVDLLTAIRYAQPTLMQLTLKLGVGVVELCGSNGGNGHH